MYNEHDIVCSKSEWASLKSCSLVIGTIGGVEYYWTEMPGMHLSVGFMYMHYM